MWRISEFTSLGGQGGVLVPGRWNSAGRPIVYAASSRALAMIEAFVHLERSPPPRTFQLLEIEAPDELPFVTWDKRTPNEIDPTSTWGDAWLAENRTALARVPSVIVPGDYNWLINPLQPRADSIRLVATIRHPWDARLFN